MQFSERNNQVQLAGALFLAVAMAAVVGGALGFEHIGGYIPCKLCLEERIPYYIGVPVALVTALAAWLRWPPVIVKAGLVIIGLLMAFNLYMAIYHSGVEWGWWAGPADCSTSSTSGIVTDAGGLLDSLQNLKPPACDQAAGRFLGLSFAGWNAVACLILAVAAFRFAFAGRKA